MTANVDLIGLLIAALGGAVTFTFARASRMEPASTRDHVVNNVYVKRP